MEPMTELPASMAEAVLAAWQIGVTDDAPGLRLSGGQEAAAFRLGRYVIRVGAPWRRDEDLAWCGSVASAAAAAVPEVIAPLPAADGRTVVRFGGHPVTVWPFVHGFAGDDSDETQRLAAADLLARVHMALSEVRLEPAPARRTPGMPVPELSDPVLDEWLSSFSCATTQLIHGDFYADNVLVDPLGRIIGLIDWDEAAVASAESELAGAAWEWGLGRETLDLAAAERFIEHYLAAGGTAGRLDEVALRQLIRQRIRNEIAYDRATASMRVIDAEDIEYQARQLEAFRALRPRRGA